MIFFLGGGGRLFGLSFCGPGVNLYLEIDQTGAATTAPLIGGSYLPKGGPVYRALIVRSTQKNYDKPVPRTKGDNILSLLPLKFRTVS